MHITGGNIVQITDFNDVSWDKSRYVNQLAPVMSPQGTTLGVLTFEIKSGQTKAYIFNYSDNTQFQKPGVYYIIKLWVRTDDPSFKLRAYTADNGERGRVFTSSLDLPPDNQWHQMHWIVCLPFVQESRSLSFKIVGEDDKITSFWAPCMSALDIYCDNILPNPDFIAGWKESLLTNNVISFDAPFPKPIGVDGNPIPGNVVWFVQTVNPAYWIQYCEDLQIFCPGQTYKVELWFFNTGPDNVSVRFYLGDHDEEGQLFAAEQLVTQADGWKLLRFTFKLERNSEVGNFNFRLAGTPLQEYYMLAPRIICVRTGDCFDTCDPIKMEIGVQNAECIDLCRPGKTTTVKGKLDVDEELDVTGSARLTGLNYPTVDGTPGQVITTDGATNLFFTDKSPGDVIGPVSSVDNRLCRFNGVTGKLIQSSTVTLDDGGNMFGLGKLTANCLLVAGLLYPVADGAPGQHIATDGFGNLSFVSAGAGDVTGPGSSNDNRICRFNGATGKIIQNSLVTIDDAGNMFGIAQTTMNALIAAGLGYPLADGTPGQIMTTDGAGNLSFQDPGTGDVVGPAGAANNRIARYDGPTGKLIKNSGVAIDGSNVMSGITKIIANCATFAGLTYPLADGALGEAITTNGAGALTFNPVGNVFGPGSSAVNRIATYADGTGKLLDDCPATCDVNGNISNVDVLTCETCDTECLRFDSPGSTQDFLGSQVHPKAFEVNSGSGFLNGELIIQPRTTNASGVHIAQSVSHPTNPPVIGLSVIPTEVRIRGADGTTSAASGFVGENLQFFGLPSVSSPAGFNSSPGVLIPPGTWMMRACWEVAAGPEGSNMCGISVDPVAMGFGDLVTCVNNSVSRIVGPCCNSTCHLDGYYQNISVPTTYFIKGLYRDLTATQVPGIPMQGFFQATRIR